MAKLYNWTCVKLYHCTYMKLCVCLFLSNCNFTYSFRELRFPEDADDVSIQQQAVLVSVGLVYYLRLDHEGRKEYKEAMDKYMWGRKDIDKALREEVSPVLCRMMQYHCHMMQ